MPNPTCAVPGCDRKLVARGYCDAHYRRVIKTGDPGGPIASQPTFAERFWPNVQKRADGCWIWTAPLGPKGYGTIYYEGTRQYVHRASYQFHGKSIPDGLQLDHLCHTNDPTCDAGNGCPHRACVNPEHLEPVPQRENLLRSNSFSGQQARQTHCIAGHEFTPENTYHWRGHRFCRRCRANRRRGASTGASSRAEPAVAT